MISKTKAAIYVAAAIVATPAYAQYYQQQSPYQQGGQQYQQQAEPDAEMRVEQLENRLRQMTGQNEELQFRIRQLEDQIQQLQAGGGGQPAARPQGAPPQRQGAQQTQPYQGQPAPQQANAQPQQYDYQQQPAQQPGGYQQPGGQQQRAQPPQAGAPVPHPSGSGGRRGDAFDPNAVPGAPGQPRALGSIVGQPSAPEQPQPDVGAPGGRAAGEPLNLSNARPQQASAQPSYQDRGQPQGRDPIGEQIATLPPSATPKDEYDLGYGYIQRKDYALAEQTLRGFIKQHPSDRLVADAQYWVGESLYQRQRYRDAAESFLTVTTKFDTATRAPDALLRLGQSLAALKEKEAACAAFGEVSRKYPKASGGVKQGIEREQKRNNC